MIFVTGGTGLVGAHLLYELLNSGNKVRALKRNTSNLNLVIKIFSYYTSQPQQLFDKIEWVEGDMLDYFRMEKLLHGVKTIFHCAATVSFSSSEREKMIANNVEGTSNLVNASIVNRIEKFCHVSSVAALGRLANGYRVNEETKWIPSKKNSGYSESKFFSEMEVWRGIEEGLNAVIVNPSIILGPGDWESGSSRLFYKVWEGLHFYTKGVTGFVDVKDVVRTMMLIMNDENFKSCKSQRFLLSSENLSYLDFFSRVAEAFGKKTPRFYISDFTLAITWRIASLIDIFRRQSFGITRNTVSGLNNKNHFDGSKITKMVAFNYTPISSTINQISKFFKSEFSKELSNL